MTTRPSYIHRADLVVAAQHLDGDARRGVEELPTNEREEEEEEEEEEDDDDDDEEEEECS